MRVERIPFALLCSPQCSAKGSAQNSWCPTNTWTNLLTELPNNWSPNNDNDVILAPHAWYKASLEAQMVKKLPAMQKTRVRFLGQEDTLRKGMATHSNILFFFFSTPVFLPGESHGQRSLVGDSPWGGKGSDATEWLTLCTFTFNAWYREETHWTGWRGGWMDEQRDEWITDFTPLIWGFSDILPNSIRPDSPSSVFLAIRPICTR